MARSPAKSAIAEEEVKAFFALPRSRLCLGALITLVDLCALGGLILLLSSAGHPRWIVPLLPLDGLMLTLLLARTPAGRGCLRTIGLGGSGSRFQPWTQVWIWGVATALGALVASLGLCR